MKGKEFIRKGLIFGIIIAILTAIIFQVATKKKTSFDSAKVQTRTNLINGDLKKSKNYKIPELTGDDIIKEACKYLGSPYKFGGKGYPDAWAKDVNVINKHVNGIYIYTDKKRKKTPNSIFQRK